jgi:hypothetical protein
VIRPTVGHERHRMAIAIVRAVHQHAGSAHVGKGDLFLAGGHAP